MIYLKCYFVQDLVKKKILAELNIPIEMYGQIWI